VKSLALTRSSSLPHAYPGPALANWSLRAKTSAFSTNSLRRRYYWRSLPTAYRDPVDLLEKLRLHRMLRPGIQHFTNWQCRCHVCMLKRTLNSTGRIKDRWRLHHVTSPCVSSSLRIQFKSLNDRYIVTSDKIIYRWKEHVDASSSHGVCTAVGHDFYRAMHYSAKRGLAIACRLSVCPSVCDVGRSGPHRLKILETNCAKFWGRLEVGS